MQLRGATASHVGNVRETNQDRAHFGGYVAVVADGMGGHQGGEMAASIAISEFMAVTEPIGAGGLVELVEGANQAVFEKAADPDLRGMGTTLVALTLRPAEEKVSVVNVGDSRAYFMRGGELGQLTLDHSLVEDLVRQNRLTPEEALTHPQRNILTRALGIASHVEVDRFLVPVELGDRFLLCSDGLFNEVPEEEIARILAGHVEPNHAADALIAAALSGAGRDNITVAIVDVVEDGRGGNLSTPVADTLTMPTIDGSNPADTIDVVSPAAPATDDGGREVGNNGFSPEMTVGIEVAASPAQPVPEPAAGDGAGNAAGHATSQVVAHDAGHDIDPAALEDDFDRAPGETAELPVTGAARPRKRRRRRRLLLPVVVLAVLGSAGYFGVERYASSGWFVGDAGGQVAVFRGRPGGFLWADAAVETATIPLTDLTTAAQDMVREQRTFDTEGEADAFVEGLARQELAEALGGVTSTEQDPAGDVLDQIDSSGGTSNTPSERDPTPAEDESTPSTASRPSPTTTTDEPGT